MSAVPYADLPQSFGPINLFGILIALGVLFGTYLARKYCERNGLDQDTLQYFGLRIIIWGFIGAHVFNTVFYDMHAFLEDPWGTTKKLGISSYGAALSGAIAYLYYTWKLKLDRRRWADMSALGAAGGWLFGRLGCALVHDHVGFKTDSPFAVDFPPMKYPWDRSDEVIRAHDLGLYEFWLWIVILAALILLERWKGRRPGFLMGFMAVTYSVPRFLFEFLRPDVTDPRYAGLTFAQWASILAFATGLWLLFGPRKAPVPEAVAVEVEDGPPTRKTATPAKKKKKKR
jgi:phosphatidylglycerol:prolipoprotein diacylglycerol transferase